MKVVIDWNSIFFKMYFALSRQNLTNENWFPTGAIYGFIKFINWLINSYGYKVEDICVAFDNPSSKDKRKEIYPQYKANRSKKDESLYKQLNVLIALLQAEGFPILSLKGYEADDICNTIAYVCQENWGSLVISRDKDLLQVLDFNHTSVLLDKGKGEYEGINQTNFKNIYPFEYKYFSIYKIIKWDKSDNVPGIKGIGDKTLETLFSYLEENNLVFDDILNGEELEDVKLEKTMKKIRGNLHIYKRNKEVLGLMLLEKFEYSHIPLFIKQDLNKADTIYNKLNINHRIIRQ